MTEAATRRDANPDQPAPRPRGRPATFDRTAAVGAALDLFWRHGYDGVAVADLKNAMGVAGQSFYHAFNSKADLYREVLRLYAAGGPGPADIEAAQSSRAAAEAMLRHGIASVTEPGRPSGCMVSSGMLMTAPENLSLAHELRAMRTSLREALQRRIERDVAEGVVAPDTDAAVWARLVATMLQGLSVQALDGAEAEDLEALTDRILAIWPTPW